MSKTSVGTHFQELYRSVAPHFAFRAESLEALAVWQADFRRELRSVLGLDRMEAELAGHAPHAKQHGSESLDGFTREHWSLWVEPTMSLPFYLLRPTSPQPGQPLILTPHGHNAPEIYVGITTSLQDENSMIEGERDIALQAVREGYTVIAPTARSFGETRDAGDKAQNKVSSCRTHLMHSLLVGRTPIGERVWDIERLLEWAHDHLDIDSSRVGITGNSGGGTVALFAAACNTRITAVVPSCYFCTFAGSIGSIFHCDCNYVPGLLRLGEMYDVAGLIAPRPFCAIAGEKDEIFPITETKRAFGKLQQIYAIAGHPEDCSLYIGPEGHRYYKQGAWPFFRHYFRAEISAS